MTDATTTKPVTVDEFEIRRAALSCALEQARLDEGESHGAGTIVQVAETFRQFLAGERKG